MSTALSGMIRYMAEGSEGSFQFNKDIRGLVTSAYSVSAIRFLLTLGAPASTGVYQLYVRITNETTGADIFKDYSYDVELIAGRTEIITFNIGSEQIRTDGVTRWSVSASGSGVSVESARVIIDGNISGSSKPSISSLAVSGTVIDNSINITWGGAEHNYYELDIETGGSRYYRVSPDSGGFSHPLAAFAIREGTNTIRVRHGSRLTDDNENGEFIGSASDYAAITQNFTRTRPAITALEPAGINLLLSKPIEVYWASSNQTGFSLSVTSGGRELKYTGTTAKVVTIPANTLSAGRAGLALTVTFAAGDGQKLTAQKTAEFNAYGPPPTPALTIAAVIAAARPVFTWEAKEQEAYCLQIWKNGAAITDSGDVFSSLRSHQFSSVLENKQSYTARLRVKNSYGLYSAWAEKGFTISFAELQKPVFSVTQNDKIGMVRLYISNASGQSGFKSCEVLRREHGSSDWVRIAAGLNANAVYTDYTPASGVIYDYAVRAVSTADGSTISDVKLVKPKVYDSVLFNTSDYGDRVILRHDPQKNFVLKRDIYPMQYMGLTAPTFEFGGQKYIEAGLSFLVERGERDIIMRLYYSEAPLLFKDSRGRSIFGYISSEPEIEDYTFYMYSMSFTFTQTHFVEEV